MLEALIQDFRNIIRLEALRPPKPPVNPHGTLRPLAPDAFGLNPQPHWLVSESGSQKSDKKKIPQVPSSLLNTKSTISQKLEITQKKQLENLFQNIAHLLRQHFFFPIFGHYNHLKIMNKIDHSSNNKNRKMNFSFFSEYCATIWTKKWKRLFSRGGSSACR